MATLTNEQIEQKKQLLAEKMKEINAITNELVEAGAIELSEADLDKATGGAHIIIPGQEGYFYQPCGPGTGPVQTIEIEVPENPIPEEILPPGM